MIKIFGKKFAGSNREAVSSLFQEDGTVIGFYRRHKRSIRFFDLNLNPIAFCNRHGVLGNAYRLERDGKTYFQAALPSSHVLYSEEIGLLAEVEEVESLAIGRDEKGLYFM